MCHFKEIGIGFINIYSPYRVEKGSNETLSRVETYITNMEYIKEYCKNIVLLPYYHHPRCGKKNAAYGNIFIFEHMYDDFSTTSHKQVRKFPARGRTIGKRILLMMFHDLGNKNLHRGLLGGGKTNIQHVMCFMKICFYE